MDNLKLNERIDLIKLAKQTQQVLKYKAYINKDYNLVDMSKAIDYTINNTIYYNESDNVELESEDNLSPTFEVTDETTCAAAIRLLSEGKENIVALNFASATTPGGGWLHGAMAQEEDLVRASALYSSIRKKTDFYNTNIILNHSYYNDGMIYSPNVPFFRGLDCKLLDKPYLLSIITSPAPNLYHMNQVDEDLLVKTLQGRTDKIIRVAIANNHKNIILGAWGCGVFGNNPDMVADCFLNSIKKYPSFDHICFAVYDTRPNQPIFNSFKKVLEEKS